MLRPYNNEASMSNNARLQNLREMTVQIRRVTDDAIVGTGIAVTMDGKVVTCAHVVEAAIGAHPRNANGAEIGVYFPQARGGETKERRAIVAKCFPQHDDDVVVLQLVGGASPLAPEQIAVLGHADASDGHGFRSYGYRRLEKYLAGFAYGRILGCIEPPENQNVQCDPVQLESNQINQGMSGAAVLDIERNLVVGIVSETWFPDLSTKDRDTAWAVNARVLSFAPLGLQMQDEPLPLRAAPQPKTDVAEARAAVAPSDRFAWNSTPDVLPEWTGRDDLLEQITQDWLDPRKHVTGLIGFGGEGKSSLARKWVDSVIASREAAKQSPINVEIVSSQKPLLAMTREPDGVFWWGFYENRSVDEFLEAALKWMSGGRIDPRAVPSSSLRAQIIGAMLGAGRYLFVLDGLEVMQHQEGDRFGLLQSNDLRDLLTYFARPDNQSFCLVTSRAPLLDLMEYTTYTHRDVDRLSAADGRALLRKLGVQGKDDALDKLVADWDGHALTLSLLSAILTERYGGDVAHVADLPAPTMNEPRYERVHRVLRRYDEHLTDAEREFLKLFSAFRTPVNEDAFDKAFLPLISKSQKPRSKLGVGELGFGISDLKAIVERLVTYRILRFDVHERTYTTHPLIRNHYLALLTKGDAAQEKAAHEQIKDYYLSIAGDTPQYPTLQDLKPLTEAVHHACQAGIYDEAEQIRWGRIEKGEKFILLDQLSGEQTILEMLKDFFPNGDTSQLPLITDIKHRAWILNHIGICLENLGSPKDAISFYLRSVSLLLSLAEWGNVSVGYRNIASVNARIGEFNASIEAAHQALKYARIAKNRNGECIALVREAWTAGLRGELSTAEDVFAQAEEMEREIDSNKKYFKSFPGMVHNRLTL
jgi:hypothetical protein